MDQWLRQYNPRFGRGGFGLETLENANKQFQDSMRKGVLAEGPDRIHDFTCGGMHLIYGLSTCLRLGHARQALAERMKMQFDILVWRLKSDLRLIDRYYSEVAGQYPAEVVRLPYLDAKLKFLGHALEVLNNARRFNLFVPTSAQEDDIDLAHKQLFEVVEAIGADGPKKAGDETLFKFLVGDACQAPVHTTFDGQLLELHRSGLRRTLAFLHQPPEIGDDRRALGIEIVIEIENIGVHGRNVDQVCPRTILLGPPGGM